MLQEHVKKRQKHNFFSRMDVKKFSLSSKLSKEKQAHNENIC